MTGDEVVIRLDFESLELLEEVISGDLDYLTEQFRHYQPLYTAAQRDKAEGRLARLFAVHQALLAGRAGVAA